MNKYLYIYLINRRFAAMTQDKWMLLGIGRYITYLTRANAALRDYVNDIARPN